MYLDFFRHLPSLPRSWEDHDDLWDGTAATRCWWDEQKGLSSLVKSTLEKDQTWLVTTKKCVPLRNNVGTSWSKPHSITCAALVLTGTDAFKYVTWQKQIPLENQAAHGISFGFSQWKYRKKTRLVVFRRAAAMFHEGYPWKTCMWQGDLIPTVGYSI